MRSIQTKADIEKKKRKNQIVIGGIMIALLVFSILGYSLASGNNDDKEKSKVNEMGIDFFRQNGLWVAEIGGGVFAFQNLPSEVSDVDVNVSASLEQYSGKPLYFVNPNNGVNEVLTNFGTYILRYQESCLRQDANSSSLVASRFECKGDLPVKGCDSNLIIFEVGNSTEVYQNESCVFIVGDSLRGTDAFLYKVLQVI